MPDAPWLGSLEELILGGAQDADMSVQELSLAIMASRQDTGLFDCAQALLTDPDPLMRQLGLDYLHYAVGGEPLTQAGVESVIRFLDGHGPSKVLVHCRKGGRAAALVLIQQARLHGWSPGEAAEKGRAMGLSVDGNLRIMVEQYLAQHPGPGRAS